MRPLRYTTEPISSARRSAVLAGSLSCTVLSSAITLLRRLGHGLSPLHTGAPHIVREPHRVSPELMPSVSMHARGGAPRREAEHVHRYRHAAGVAVTDLDVAIDHHGRAHEPHGAHADGIAELLELVLQGGDPRVGVARADRAQARGLLAEHHGGVLGTSEPHADDGRL